MLGQVIGTVGFNLSSIKMIYTCCTLNPVVYGILKYRIKVWHCVVCLIYDFVACLKLMFKI